MNLTEMSVRKPVTISMLFMGIMVLSLVAFSKLGIDLLPDFSYPVLTVVTTNTGMGPQEIEEKITRKIETGVGTVNNIKNIKSISAEGISVVSIEFVWGTDMAEASADVREKVDVVRGKLPDTAEKPLTYKFDPNSIPVYIFVLSGLPMAKAKDYADNYLKAELEQVEGVSAINPEGGRKQQIQIQIDRTRLLAYNYSFEQVVNILRSENLNQPAGDIKVGFDNFTIRTEAEFKNIEQIRKTVIGVSGRDNKRAVYLEDLATVIDAFEDKTEIRTQGKTETITIQCLKRSGENTVQVVDRLITKLEKIKKSAPRGAQFLEVFNQSDYIKTSINNVASAAKDAAILSIIVILVFLRNLRATFIISLALPTSILITFFFMYMGDLTLNMISFGGLALGVGMLVDNSIVVLENIFRHKQRGEDKISAAILGTKEVAMPIIASTLTHICVFLPLIFVKGASSILFKQMAMTVSFSLLASLFVAMTIIPMLSSKLIEISNLDEREFKVKSFGYMFRMGQVLLDGLDRIYTRAIHWALHHRKTIVYGAAVIFFVSMWIFGFVQKGFMAEQDNDQITGTIQLKEGTRLEVTEALVFRIADRIKQIEGVNEFICSMGTGNNVYALAQGKVGTHFISFRIKLLKKADRKIGHAEIRERIRPILAAIPGITFTFQTSSGMGSQTSALEIQVRGQNLDASLRTAKNIMSIMQKDHSKELKDIDLSRKDGTDEIILKINRIKAATLGFNVAQIATTIQNNFVGNVATTYKITKDEVDIVARLKETQRLTLEDLGNVTVKSPLGFSVPILQIVDVKKGKSPARIERLNQERVIYVKANNMPDVGIVNVVDKLKEQIDREVVIPEGINVFYGGSYQDSQESSTDLMMALLLSVLLIYMVMCAQFESFLNPFLIMFTIPLGLIGVSWAFFLTGTELNVNGYLGIIMLSGIVVNNGIIMIDYIRQLRQIHGMELFDAVITGGRTRLRPVIMTALTTTLGMVPLALASGSGSEVNKPLAIAVVGGMTVSTLLTLVFVPVLYSVFNTFILKRRRRKLKKA